MMACCCQIPGRQGALPQPNVPVQAVQPALPPGDMTLKAFILQKPDGPTAVQVDCELSTYYNWAFRACAATHYSFKLESRSPVYSLAFAYAEKESNHGQVLYEALKNGNKQKHTLQIQRIGPDGIPLPARDDQCFALLGIVQAQK
jgi:hypothetical protein